MADQDAHLEEIGRMRQKYRRRYDEMLRDARFISEHDWLALAMAGTVQGMISTEHDILISVCGAALPSIGTWWTGLLVINPHQRDGHAWFNEIDGLIPPDGVVRVAANNGKIRRPIFDVLLDLLNHNEIDTFRAVPSGCYDGAPTSVNLCTRRTGHIYETSANASDTGPATTLELVKLLWAIKLDILYVKSSPLPASCHPPTRNHT